ncbi:MAG: imidazole glycerol phosphate synthase subunit HisH [Stygiobacter sp.]|uniref:Imidazole glycerol phosphate synthase subunit HisH n=1 Tax=Stygiobacter electus TaxID=3032292 RepID=A0AAE3TBR0_9BACT|nr:imidazole glycerol phosphate synthase subunit HisH [Stygiobacter electus]MDF1610681.1 imidazole glycerol phosphate synthase subunit HisH [Stygiobacter electus]
MIAVIDYGAGNTKSVTNVLDELKVEYIVTSREIDINKSKKIIFPGVGEASFAIRKLHLNNLFTLLRITKKPLLGICLGMQLLADETEEGNTTCLGIIPTICKKFENESLKIPQMGWNKVKVIKENPLFEDIGNDSYFYFANSYYMPMNEFTTASSNYGIDFTASIQKDNFFGVQFHPEKSGEAGIKLLKNFIEKC